MYIKSLPFASKKAKESKRALDDTSLTIYDVIDVSIVGSLEEKSATETDSSILSYTLEKENQRSIAIKIQFADIKSLTQSISEPDLLGVRIIKPDVFIDAETDLPLELEDKQL